MQIKSLRVKSYRSWCIEDRVIPEIAKIREEKIKLYHKLREDGCQEKTALQAVNLTRTTFYRLQRKYNKEGILGLANNSKRPHNFRKNSWDKSLYSLVLKLRKENPLWGREKIHRLIIRDYNMQVSSSMVGRIIADLVKKKLVKAVSTVVGRNGKKKKRKFNKHAKKWQYGMKSKVPGELIQIDHMSVNDNGKRVKHFKAVCPKSKCMVAEVYSNANSSTAKRFLEKVIEELPFAILSIQVDGGSEFMKDFEEACKEKDIPLFVLPPKLPKYNGNVERCNGVTRDEFYLLYDGDYTVGSIRNELQKFQNKYNNYRPHRAINNLTPMEYYKLYYQVEAA